MKNLHRQAWVKVNAPIDVGVSALIRVLSGFPRLQTIESCEGEADCSAWVCFRYGDYWKHPWRDIADFVLGYLGPNLVRGVGDAVNLSIRVTEAGFIQAELEVRRGAMPATIKTLEKLLQEFGR